MAAGDDDFRDFVGGFGGPLARLAYLLTVTDDPGSAERSQSLALAALTHTKRRWRDVQLTGAPEPVAVEGMLARLAKHQRRRKAAAVDLGVQVELAEMPGGDGDDQFDGVDVAVMHEVLWRSWLTLGARQRVPLVFADPSVASRRLAGLDVPESFASERRQEILAQQAVSVLQLALAQDSRLVNSAPVDEAQLRDLLASVLTEHVQDAFTPIDAYTVVAGHAARSRRRGAIAVAGVVAVLVAATVTVVNVSASNDRTAKAAASASLASARATAIEAPAKNANAVVSWPARGELRGDAQLLANVRTAFVTAHPDAFGQAQILLATDTPYFRLVYATAQSRTGILQSWFYGPVGSETLTEGAFEYGRQPAQQSVVAVALDDTEGHAVLVVIGPPGNTDVRLNNTEVTDIGAQFAEVPHSDGIAVRDITGIYVPLLFLRVSQGGVVDWDSQVSTVQLVGSTSLVSARPAPSSSPAGSGTAGSVTAGPAPSGSPSVLPSVTQGSTSIAVERGKPDPALLQIALQVERQWELTGELSASGVPVVVWAGTDPAGARGLVLRVKTLHLSDLAVVVWSNAPSKPITYRLAPDVPDAPLVFGYDGGTGASVGVIAPHGVTQVGLVVDGVDLGVNQVDPNGFTSLLVGHQYGVLAEQTLAVDLFDSTGRQISRVPVTPTA